MQDIMKTSQPITVSLEFDGCYVEHKQFFDAMAQGLQAVGHKVGIITSKRIKEYDYNNNMTENDKVINEALGFKPDFMYLWGENETIANGALWKCRKMDQENVTLHFGPDATEMKRYTDRWVVKTMDSGQVKKF